MRTPKCMTEGTFFALSGPRRCSAEVRAYGHMAVGISRRARYNALAKEGTHGENDSPFGRVEAKAMRPQGFAGQKGFTLLELIVVLVMVGIFASIATSNVITSNFSAYSDGEILKSSLRYARTRALADILPWSFQVAGQSGTFQRNNVVMKTVDFATNGVAAGTTTFDNRGQPTGTMSYAVTEYPASPVVITPQTGFVP